MKKAFAGIVAIAGLATIASAATTVQYQVRTIGGTWGSSVDALPGATVEFRALLSTDQNVAGFAAFNSQPMVSDTVATDAFAPFLATGGAAFSFGGGINDFDANPGSYGRRSTNGLAGISTTNALRGHTNLSSGVRYMRIAQNNTTNFPGSGTGANNVNGAGGVAMSQNPATFAGPNFIGGTENIEMYRFAFIVSASGGDGRVLSVSSALPAMIVGTATPLVARVNWYTSTDSSALLTDAITAVNAATINVVPTPGALALLGMGGLIAGRRRRA